jgi:glutathione synthase
MKWDDACAALTGGQRRVFFLGDPEETLDRAWDSSLRLLEAHRRRGENPHWVTAEDILIRDRTLLLEGVRVWPEDVVWLRLDPSASVRWYETLRALCHVEARLVNPPAAVLTVHDKRAALPFSPRCSWSVFSARQLGDVSAALRRMGVETAVVKPPSLFASKGVCFVPVADAPALATAFASLVDLFGYVIVEPKLGPPGDQPPADRRVLMTSRRVLGVVDRTTPLNGAEGYRVEVAGPLTPAQSRTTARVAGMLRFRGILLAGLDFIGDVLTEVNVSCPGAIPEIDRLCGISAEDLIVEDLNATRRRIGQAAL